MVERSIFLACSGILRALMKPRDFTRLAALIPGIGLAAFGIWSTPPAAEPAQDETVRFARDVLPILSDKCFLCHGPDISSRMADLRLDLREHAVADRDGFPVIVPGDADASFLVERIFDEESPMPPEGAKPLTLDEKETLKRWIEQGAKYEKHWAFEALPDSVAVPGGSKWANDDLDRFVEAGLNTAGLKPSRAATPERWLRRVTFDLTGLPPTPEEISKFLADGSKSEVVDRLLASEHYGERMAVPWLDAARYSDSYGYQSDLLSPNWPYRDWVVRAYNENLPYDDFLTWQLAGDLLPNSTRDQKLATAFNRIHRMTNEGGSIEEEFRTEYASDRVDTFGTSVLGLTVGCARCHDHKFDPFSQKEYYQLVSYFNSIDEYGMYISTEIVPAPTLLLPDAEQETRLRALRKASEDANADFERVGSLMRPIYSKWLANMELPTEPAGAAAHYSLDALKDGKYPDALGGETTANLLGAPESIEGVSGKGLKLNGDNGISFPGMATPSRWTPFTWSFWIKDTMLADRSTVVIHKTGGTDVGFSGFDLMIDKGILMARAMRQWPGNAVAIKTKKPIKKDAWTHIVWSYDGRSKASSYRLFINGEQAETEVVRDRLWKSANAYGDHGPSGNKWSIGQRFRDFGFKSGLADEFTYYTRVLSSLEAKHLYDGETMAKAAEHPERYPAELYDHYLWTVDSSAAALLKRVHDAEKPLTQHENTIYEVMVMEEMPEQRPTYLLARGDYDAPKTEDVRVSRGVPQAMGIEVPEGSPDNRLGLANWATDPNHPLTARIAVNRIWQTLFGRGLVETQENFGIQGSYPSHPELLDYLAREFVDSGWDTKGLIKRIVLSSTYSQDSALNQELLENDPENLLLSRGPSHRLSAEMLRDQALAASGLLNKKLGGAPVSPYQPPGLWRENNGFSPAYAQSKGDDLYRRSLYTVWKRTAPSPSMMAFDSTSREFCTVRRSSTNTPLQALVLLNDVQFFEACRVLAERAMESSPGDQDRIQFSFVRLAGRNATTAELEILIQLLAEQRAEFSSKPEDATKLLGPGQTKPDEAISLIELAAMTTTVQAMMNMDACVWSR
jgi:hypothetical protein